MSDIVIKAEGIGKSYLIGHKPSGGRYVALRDVIADKVKGFWSKIRGSQKNTRADLEEFWALKDVFFEVKQGERIGIIGRNGAGKSTLLKILSRITEPTKGRISIKGRVASLLEVGTGFHPELTGRETSYLNGAILGMARREIKRKFDEIVNFAEVEKFLDTPVKRFSSGMYVRLAFSVAAHLEPEILVIDEVLAVGDIQFQEKCLGKMRDITSQNQRTILFVSHNMQAVRTLCSRVILLEGGRVSMDGGESAVINQYSALMRTRKIDEKTDLRDKKHRRGDGAIRFTSIAVTDAQGVTNFNFNMGDEVHFKVDYETYKPLNGIRLFIGLRGGLTREIVTSFEHLLTEREVPPGTKGSAVLVFPDIKLRPGDYPLYFGLMDQERSVGSTDIVDDVTLPITIGVRSYGLEDGFDSRSPVGHVSLPSHLVNNKVFPGRS